MKTLNWRRFSVEREVRSELKNNTTGGKDGGFMKSVARTSFDVIQEQELSLKTNLQFITSV